MWHLCSPFWICSAMMLPYRFAVIWDCYDVNFLTFRHMRLLRCSIPVVSSCKNLWRSLPYIPQYEVVIIFISVIPSRETVMVFTSDHFVTRDCYDVLFRSIRLVRILWCSLPLISLREIVTMFTSGRFITLDCYDVLFRSIRHVRLLWRPFPVNSSREIFMMFSSGLFVAWECCDVLFRLIRHVRLLWCSLPVTPMTVQS